MRELKRVTLLVLVPLQLFWVAPLTHAPRDSGDREFALRLEVRSGEQEQAARSDSDAAAARPVLTVKTKTPLRVRWSVSSLEKTGAVTDVTVHCFLAKEVALGQRALPNLTDTAPYESALTMDFAPGRESAADFVAQLPEPGDYLLRVEALDPEQPEKSPDFAALDVRVE